MIRSFSLARHVNSGKSGLKRKKMSLSLTPAISYKCFNWTVVNNRPFTGAVYPLQSHRCGSLKRFSETANRSRGRDAKPQISLRWLGYRSRIYFIAITSCAPAQEWCLRRPSCNKIQITSRAPLVPHSLVQVAETGTILAATPNRIPARKSSRFRSVVQIYRLSCNGPEHDWRGLLILPMRLVKITCNKRKAAGFSEERTGPSHSSPWRLLRLC